MGVFLQPRGFQRSPEKCNCGLAHTEAELGVPRALTPASALFTLADSSPLGGAHQESCVQTLLLAFMPRQGPSPLTGDLSPEAGVVVDGTNKF